MPAMKIPFAQDHETPKEDGREVELARSLFSNAIAGLEFNLPPLHKSVRFLGLHFLGIKFRFQSISNSHIAKSEGCPQGAKVWRKVG